MSNKIFDNDLVAKSKSKVNYNSEPKKEKP